MERFKSFEKKLIGVNWALRWHPVWRHRENARWEDV
jgi:hypothetical protein